MRIGGGGFAGGYMAARPMQAGMGASMHGRAGAPGGGAQAARMPTPAQHTGGSSKPQAAQPVQQNITPGKALGMAAKNMMNSLKDTFGSLGNAGNKKPDNLQMPQMNIKKPKKDPALTQPSDPSLMIYARQDMPKFRPSPKKNEPQQQQMPSKPNLSQAQNPFSGAKATKTGSAFASGAPKASSAISGGGLAMGAGCGSASRAASSGIGRGGGGMGMSAGGAGGGSAGGGK